MSRLRHLVVAVVALAILGIALAPSSNAQTGNDELDKIEHIVMIMQENRTFDHYFGMFPGAEGFTLDASGNPSECIPNPSNPAPASTRPTIRASARSAARTTTNRTLLP